MNGKCKTAKRGKLHELALRVWCRRRYERQLGRIRVRLFEQHMFDPFTPTPVDPNAPPALGDPCWYEWLLMSEQKEISDGLREQLQTSEQLEMSYTSAYYGCRGMIV